MSKEIKNCVVIGCGTWGVNHVDFLSSQKRLKGIFDIDKKKTLYVSKQYKCKAYKNYKQILNDEEVENIFITNTAKNHFKTFNFLSKSKKNFFIEKPICLKFSELKKMKKIIKKNKIKFSSGHLLHYHSCLIQMIKLIKKNSIGKILSIKALRQNFGKFRHEEDVITSLMPHDISIIFKILNNYKNKKIKAKILNLKFLLNVFDESRLFVKFNKINILVSVSWVSYNKRHEFVVLGDRGMLIFNDTNPDINKKLELIKFDYISKDNKIFPNIRSKEYVQYESDKRPLQEELKYTLDYFDSKIINVINNFDEAYDVMSFLFKVKNKNIKLD